LRNKSLAGAGIRLLSLERLEAMIRHAIMTAFPLLTAGVLVGMILLVPRWSPMAWLDPRILSTGALWLPVALPVSLPFSSRLRARRVALLTIVAFGLLVCTLAASHTVTQGGGP